MKTYVINLDFDQAKLKHMKYQLDSLNLAFERIPGISKFDYILHNENGDEYVDQAKATQTNLFQNINKFFDGFWMSPEYKNDLIGYNSETNLINMSLSEVCAAQAHRKAWEQAMNNDFSLILEDDITFYHDPNMILNYLTSDERSFDFDIFLLDWCSSPYCYLNIEETEYKIKYLPVKKISGAFFASAYIITRDMAETLYESTVTGPVDVFLSNLYPNYNVYGCKIAAQTEWGASNNDHSQDIGNYLLA
jgi:GR25 family glycosyltransferase involved in LPS biosynthesis